MSEGHPPIARGGVWLSVVQAEIGKTEWVMGEELLTNSIHWTDGQLIAWPDTTAGATALGEYINWA